MPRWLARRPVRRTQLQVIVKRLTSLLSWTARVLRPRLEAVDARSLQLAGVLGVVLSAVLVLPLPLVNVPIGLALVLLSLGGLHRDGLLVVLGVATGVGSLAFAVGVVFGLVQFGNQMFVAGRATV